MAPHPLGVNGSSENSFLEDFISQISDGDNKDQSRNLASSPFSSLQLRQPQINEQKPRENTLNISSKHGNFPSIFHLPELIRHIASYLEPKDFERFRGVGRAFDAALIGEIKQITIRKIEHISALVEFLPKAKTLGTLTFEGLEFNHKFLTDLQALSGAFKHLQLISCSGITAETLTALLTATPHLETLELGECKNITNAVFTALSPKATENLQKLKSLDLSYTKIGNEGLAAILEHMPNLETLNLAGCENITNTAFTALSSKAKANLQKLKSLDLSCTNISNEDLAAILEHTPNLEILNLAWCEKLTNTAFIALSAKAKENLQKLKSLDLGDMDISNEMLSAILEHTPNLETLNLGGCKNLTVAAFTALSPKAKENLQQLKSLDLRRTNINNEVLSAVLEHTPNLETLHLVECGELTIDAFTGMNVSVKENLVRGTWINLSDTNIDEENLILLKELGFSVVSF